MLETLIKIDKNLNPDQEKMIWIQQQLVLNIKIVHIVLCMYAYKFPLQVDFLYHKIIIIVIFQHTFVLEFLYHNIPNYLSALNIIIFLLFYINKTQKNCMTKHGSQWTTFIFEFGNLDTVYQQLSSCPLYTIYTL